MRHTLGSLLFAITFLATAGGSVAGELVMLTQQGCAWCLRFEREIGPAYSNTKQGKVAPLRRVDIGAPWPADLPELRVDRFTPTFVLVEGGREIARMRGYAGDEFFWFLLDEMLARKAGATPAG